MVIIFNIFSLGAGIICLLLCSHLWRSFPRNNIYAFKGYSLAFFFLGLAFVILSFPAMILFDPLRVQINFIITDLLFFGSALFFGKTTVSFLEIALRLKRTVLFIISFCILLYVFSSVIFFSPAVSLEMNDVVFYWKSGMPWLQGTARALFCLVAALVAIFFLREAKMIRKRISSKRAFLLGLSGLMIFVGGFIFWFLPFFYFTPDLLNLSGLLGFLGMVIGGTATFLFRQPQKLWTGQIISKNTEKKS